MLVEEYSRSGLLSKEKYESFQTPEDSLLENKTNLLRAKICWTRTGDYDYPFQATYKKCDLKINMVQEKYSGCYMYLLYVNQKRVLEFEDWPKNWKQKDLKRTCIIS